MYATVIAKGVTDFANNCELLKYGLHWDAVISRWARELANEVGALDVTKKLRHMQIYRSFSIYAAQIHSAKLQLFPELSKLFGSFFEISSVF